MFLFWILAFLLFSVRPCSGESVFDFSVLSADGENVSMSRFTNARALIVVNVASNCGYTYTNYRELQKLYEQYQPHGLEIVGFPSNQFGDQESGTDQEIQQFVKNYGITWPVMAKTDVNGPGAHDLFRFLKEKTGHVEINWNFNKFLVVDGSPVKRYVANVSPKKMEGDLRRILGLAEPEL